MKTEGQILRDAYARLARRFGTWAAMAGLAASLLVPGLASAAQLTARSSTVGSSAAGATTTYATTFTFGTSGQSLAAIKFEICDSPLFTSACVNTGGSNGVSMSAATLTTQTGTSATGFTIGTRTANSAIITRTAANITGTPTASYTLGNVVNPTTANSSYYLRISTYTNTAATTPAYPGTDNGSVALSTTQSITVAANVQESLVFCTGTNVAVSTGCGDISGSTVNIGTGTDNVLASTPSGAASVMYASTNATTGYSITYTAATFSSTGDTIASVGSTPTAFPAAGTAAFGINLKANTSPSITNSADVSGSGTGTVATNYATANQFAFVPATATTVASATVPTVQNKFVVSYAAQAGSTTKPGAFSTSFNYIATGNF